MKDKPKALGRGLSALIPGAGAPTPLPIKQREYFECAIEDVHPSDDNPRKAFDGDKLRELAETIRNQGVAQPLLVRARQGGGFTLIAGERRWRASQLAGLKSVPVVVKDVSPQQAFEIALVENLQRQDLNPIEEAEAYQRLIGEHSWTQEHLAERIGKDCTSVTNTLRLLKLPVKVRNHVASGELPMGHARALLGLLGPRPQDGAGGGADYDAAAAIERSAARVIAKQLSVRQTEELVRKEKNGGAGKAKNEAPGPSASVRHLVERLERAMGTRVRLTQKSQQAGTIEIDYASLDQLDGLLERLLRP